MFKKNFIQGIQISLGIIFGLSIFFGIIYATGFHSANEVLSGVFQGDYTFSGDVVINGSSEITDVDNDLSKILFLVSNLSSQSLISLENGFFDSFNNQNYINTTLSTNEVFNSLGYFENLQNTSIGTWDDTQSGTLTFGDQTYSQPDGFSFTMPADGDFLSVDYEHTSLVDSTNVNLYLYGGEIGNTTTNYASKTALTMSTGTQTFIFDTTPTLVGGNRYWLGRSYNNGGDGVMRTVNSNPSYGSGRHSQSSGVGLGGISDGQDMGGVDWRVRVNLALSADMSLVSKSYSSSSNATSVTINIFQQDVSTVNISNDLVVSISNNNGNSWSQVSLVDKGNISSNIRFLTGKVTGLTSNSSVMYNYTVLNNKLVKLEGIGVSWS